MKLALASLAFVAPAMAFSPTASFGVKNTALKMSTETETEKRGPGVPKASRCGIQDETRGLSDYI